MITWFTCRDPVALGVAIEDQAVFGDVCTFRESDQSAAAQRASWGLGAASVATIVLRRQPRPARFLQRRSKLSKTPKPSILVTSGSARILVLGFYKAPYLVSESCRSNLFET